VKKILTLYPCTLFRTVTPYHCPDLKASTRSKVIDVSQSVLRVRVRNVAVWIGQPDWLIPFLARLRRRYGIGHAQVILILSTLNLALRAPILIRGGGNIERVYIFAAFAVGIGRFDLVTLSMAIGRLDILAILVIIGRVYVFASFTVIGWVDFFA
jgi:hypothetical protein